MYMNICIFFCFSATFKEEMISLYNYLFVTFYLVVYVNEEYKFIIYM